MEKRIPKTRENTRASSENLYNDYIFTYDELLEKAGANTLLINRLRLMALTVFKSLNSLNPPCLNDIFSKKSVPYWMRDSCIIEQPKRRTTTFGLRSFSYVGTKVWNELPTYLTETTDLNDFKSLLDTWNGPDLIDTTFIHKHFIWLMCICMQLYMCVYACIYIHVQIYTWLVHPCQVWSYFWASTFSYW